MKLLADFLPIILFFGTFKYADSHREWAVAFASEHFGWLVAGGKVDAAQAPVLLATVVVIVATLAQVLFLKLRGRRVDTLLWVSLGLVTVLGGLTIWLQSEAFIKWKPTLLYWVMAAAFALGPLLFKKNLLRLSLGEQLKLPERVWRGLNHAWVAFFAVMGALNLWVAQTFSTATWVSYKLFGGMGLLVAFIVAQGLVLARYLPDEPEAGQPPAGQVKP